MPRRRDVLVAGGVGACALAVQGCDRTLREVAHRLEGPSLRGAPPVGSTVDPIHHLLNRVAFGPRPGEVATVRSQGADAWLEEQLHPELIDDTATDLRAGLIDAMVLPDDLLFELRPERVEEQLVAHTMICAVSSNRQLLEVMVRFWSDHFNVAIGKQMCQQLSVSYQRDVIRTHALASFKTLLRATALSGAMLVYLDGRDNRRERAGDLPNENYARELLELHALGVHGGYTQRDVMEAARCLTGWVVHKRWTPGRVAFVPARHDDGDKMVLGRRIPAGGGARDLDRLLDVLVAHPACARFVALRLCRHLVADEPPEPVVRAAAETFTRTGGEMREVVRTIVSSETFWASANMKLKRPFRFVVSALRALHGETDGRPALTRHLLQMGQAPFRHPTPDGYPQDTQAWLGTLAFRWSFARDLMEERIDGTRTHLEAVLPALLADDRAPHLPLARHLLGRDPTGKEMHAMAPCAHGADATARIAALLLSSPAFQRC